MDNMENQEHPPRLMAPPVKYAFNNLIQDFVDEINGDDVEVIKQRFEDIFPSEVQTGRQIVYYLRENDYISEINIIYLQQIIRKLRRPNLLLKTIDFAKCNEGTPVLHFRETTTKIRPGYQVIKIHVEGHGRINHEELDELRHKISKIVLVPPEDVSIAGIEETSSLIITIVLPAKHINECEASITDRNEDKLLLTPESSNTEGEINVEEKLDEVVETKSNKNLVTKSDKKRKRMFQPYTVSERRPNTHHATISSTKRRKSARTLDVTPKKKAKEDFFAKQKVWAKFKDGVFYPAMILEVNNSGFKVRWLEDNIEGSLKADDLRPYSSRE